LTGRTAGNEFNVALVLLEIIPVYVGLLHVPMVRVARSGPRVQSQRGAGVGVPFNDGAMLKASTGSADRQAAGTRKQFD